MNKESPGDSLWIREFIHDKSVLYISTKDRDYLRVEQEISLIKTHAKNIEELVSHNKSYFIRLPYIYFKLFFNLKKYDTVFIGFAPQLILPLFFWKFKNNKVIIDFFISIYDTLVFDRKKFKKSSFIAKIIKKIDAFTLKVSDFVICDTKEHARYFINELGANPAKTDVLYLNADSKYYHPKTCSKPDKLKDKYIVLYFGTILPLQGVEIIIEAINKIKTDDIHFIMIGPLKNKSKQDDLKNVTFIDWLPQDILSDYIAFSDLCLAGHFHGTIEKAKRVIPGKAYIYEAMNKKMILGDNTANRERYPIYYDNVIFIEMGNSTILAETILNEYKERRNNNVT